jgi:hypothetical protein
VRNNKPGQHPDNPHGVRIPRAHEVAKRHRIASFEPDHTVTECWEGDGASKRSHCPRLLQARGARPMPFAGRNGRSPPSYLSSVFRRRFGAFCSQASVSTSVSRSWSASARSTLTAARRFPHQTFSNRSGDRSTAVRMPPGRASRSCESRPTASQRSFPRHGTRDGHDDLARPLQAATEQAVALRPLRGPQSRP